MPRLGGALDIVQVSEPASPQSGREYLYFKSDGILYLKQSDGTVSSVYSTNNKVTPTDIAAGTFPGAAYVFGDGTAAEAVRINGLTSLSKLLDFQSSGLSRWKIQSLGGGEAGSNAGSDLVVRRFADDGTTSLGDAIAISRSTGVATLSASPVVPDGSFSAAKLSATGTRDATTFLRGDNTWAAPGGPASAVQTVSGTRALTGANGNTIAIGSLTLATYGPMAVRITLTDNGTASNSNKVFLFNLSSWMSGSTLNAWTRALAFQSSINPTGSGDYYLEIRRTSNSTWEFRLRDTDTAMTINYVIEIIGPSGITFTSDSTVLVAPAAVNTLFSGTPLTMVEGFIGVKTDYPAYEFDVAGTVQGRTSVRAPALTASGLTGTIAGRYVGATTTGAPTTGTFSAGDYVVAKDGAVWICTAAGSPGTWAQSGGSASPIQTFAGSRTMTGNGDAVAIGSFTFATLGNMSIRVTLSDNGTSLSNTNKTYIFNLSSFMTSVPGVNSWVRAVPLQATQRPLSGTDSYLEITRGGGSIWKLRLHDTGGSNPMTITYVIEIVGPAGVTFTPDTTVTSAPPAVTTIFAGTPMTLTGDGRVGVMTDNPQYTLDVVGTVQGSAEIRGGLVSAVGVTGTIGSRFVGATGSGAPTSGTFSLGDFSVARNGSFWICTTAGSPGTWTQVVTTTTAATVLETVISRTTAYTVAAGVSTVLANGTFTVTIPAAASNTGRVINIKNTGTGVITIATAGGNIDGVATLVQSTQYVSVSVVSDGTNWFVI